jgi:hypothetical protein
MWVLLCGISYSKKLNISIRRKGFLPFLNVCASVRSLSLALNKLRLSSVCIQDDMWKPSHFLDNHSPLSPCVSVQWTLRDGAVVNLPNALLVEGDVILLRPGQIVPARCRPIKVGFPNWHIPEKLFFFCFHYRMIILKPMSSMKDAFINRCSLSQMAKASDQTLSQHHLYALTPFLFLKHLSSQIWSKEAVCKWKLNVSKILFCRIFLELSSSRPTSFLNIERHNVYSGIVEKIGIPVLLVCGFCVE